MMYSEHRTHAISLVILWLLCSTQFHVSQSFTLRVSSTKLGTSSSVIPHGASSRLQESINQNVLQEEVILDPASTLSQNQIDTISSLVQARAQARCEGRYSEADQLRSQLQGILLPDEHLTILLQDMPRSVGGGSQWNLVRRVEMTPLPGTTVLQLAHAALGLAMASSEQACLVDTNRFDALVQQLIHDLPLHRRSRWNSQGTKSCGCRILVHLGRYVGYYTTQSIGRYGSGRIATVRDSRHVSIAKMYGRFSSGFGRRYAPFSIGTCGAICPTSQGRTPSPLQDREVA
jgi:hypothetical protein